MSRSASDVSVISVNWNGRRHLEHLVPSVLEQSPGEFIVVDNGSSDDSVPFLRSYRDRVRIIENPQNEGFAQPCNLAAEAARRPVLAFINNDMRADREWLSAALPHLTPRTPCVACRILDWEGKRIDYNGSSLQYLGYALQRDIGRLADEVSHDDRVLFACGGAALFDRDVFLTIGGFDPDFFAIYEDVDLGWRLWLAGYEVGFAADSLTFHRGHASFESRPHEKMRYLMHRNALYTALKNYEEPWFRRILPLALVLGLKRAIHFAGVRRQGFYLWEETRHGLSLDDPLVRERVLDSLNHLVALDDVLDRLPRILEKRKLVQRLRRRPDEEIVRLFRDPLRPIVLDPEYRTAERRWLQLLDLTTLLGEPEAVTCDRGPHLDAALRRVGDELAAKSWVAGRAWVNPPAPGAPGLRTRARSLWRMGWAQAWRRLMDSVNRGI